MWRNPEELVMLVLAALWVAAHYFLAAWATSANVFYTFLITILVAIWTIIVFQLWRKDLINKVIPIAIGLWVAILTAWLNYFAAGAATWYATWTLKILVVIVISVVGYFWQFKRAEKRRLRGQI